MSFLEPGGLWLLAFIPPVMLLYLLKLRRTRRAVSSTMLWQKVCHEAQANAFWQKLRRHLLLLIQILVVILLAIAFARPYLPEGRVVGRDLLLIIDNSASMRALEPGGLTRLQTAVARARTLAAGLGPNDAATIMITAPVPRVLLNNADDAQAVNEALAAIRPAGAVRLEGALTLARQLLSHAPDRRAYLLSDGGGETEPLGPDPAARLHWLPIGASAPNLALVAADLRQPLPAAPAQLMAAARNCGPAPVTAMLRVLRDNVLVEARELTLAANERSVAVFDLPAAQAAGEFRLELVYDDALPDDNSAFLVRRSGAKLRVAHIGEDNSPPARALLRWNGVALSTYPAGTLPPAGSFDLAIWQADGPPAGLAGAHCVFAPRPGDFGAHDTYVEKPEVVAWDRISGPLARGNFTRMFIARTRPLDPPAAGRTLLRGPQGPLAVELEEANRHIVVFGFALAESDFAYRVAFPVFLGDLLSWARAQTGGGRLTLAAGERWLTGATAAGLTRPDGSAVAPDPATGAITATDQVGFYRRADGSAAFAVSLLADGEADLAVASVPDPAAETGSDDAAERDALVETWPWFVLLACLALFAEWWLYHRRLFGT